MELPSLPIFSRQKIKDKLKQAGQGLLHGVQKVGRAEIDFAKETGREAGQVVSNIARTIDTNKKKVFAAISPKSPEEGLAQGMIPSRNRDGGYSYIDATGITEIKNVGKVVAEETKPLVKNTLGKLIDAIKESKPIRKGQEALYTAERAKRAAVGSKLFENIGGEEGYRAALGSMKGELPKVKFESPRLKFVQEEVDELFTKIKDTPGDFFEKITASNGLAKILGDKGGTIPTDSELKTLQKIFGSDLVDAVRSKRTNWEKFREGFANVLNVPRSLMSSVDMSAPLRQGVVLMASKPKQGLKASFDMFKYFGSDATFKTAMEDIFKRPTAQLMKESGLALTDITDQAVGLGNKEEAFMSNLAEKIPVAGKLVKASERAYVGFLNKIRADVFDSVAQEYFKAGIKPETRPEVFKGLAEFINTSSGRGNLGRFSSAGPVLNGVFFSPRLIASRVQMLNPVWYAKMPPEVRKEAVKDFLTFIGVGVGLVSLAKLGGAKVETDPRSTDFAKIRMGNTRYDVWGGFQQWVRLGAQLITGEVKSSNTGKVRKLDKTTFPYESRLDRTLNFFEGKFAPVPGLITDLMRGQTLIGEPIEPEEFYNKVIPLYFQDIKEAVKDRGAVGAVGVAVPGFFGMGVQTYKATEPKNPKSPFKSTAPLPQLPKLPKLNN